MTQEPGFNLRAFRMHARPSVGQEQVFARDHLPARCLDLAYPDAVKAKLDDVAAEVATGDYCANPAALVEELDALSRMILARVASFAWTLTRDGLDYAPASLGCSGLKCIRQKPSCTPCPQQRRHGKRHAITGQVLPTRTLAIGE